MRRRNGETSSILLPSESIPSRTIETNLFCNRPPLGTCIGLLGNPFSIATTHRDAVVALAARGAVSDICTARP